MAAAPFVVPGRDGVAEAVGAERAEVEVALHERARRAQATGVRKVTFVERRLVPVAAASEPARLPEEERLAGVGDGDAERGRPLHHAFGAAEAPDPAREVHEQALAGLLPEDRRRTVWRHVEVGGEHVVVLRRDADRTVEAPVRAANDEPQRVAAIALPRVERCDEGLIEVLEQHRDVASRIDPDLRVGRLRAARHSNGLAEASPTMCDSEVDAAPRDPDDGSDSVRVDSGADDRLLKVLRDATADDPNGSETVRGRAWDADREKRQQCSEQPAHDDKTRPGQESCVRAPWQRTVSAAAAFQHAWRARSPRSPWRSHSDCC